MFKKLLMGLSYRFGQIASDFKSIPKCLIRHEDDFEFLNQLGKGSTSRVFEGYDIVTQKKQIIKLFKQIPPQKIQRQIYCNNLLADLQCQNIIKLEGVIQNQGCGGYGLIFEYKNGCPLNLLTLSNSKVAFSPKQSIIIIKRILQAIRIMHANNIIHRDIKPGNILINMPKQQNSIKSYLFDFGSAIIQTRPKMTGKFGTKCYKPPESIFFNQYYNHKIDIWCIGIIMAQLLSKTRCLLPYSNDLAMMQQIVNLCGFDSDIIGKEMRKYVNQNGHFNWTKFMPGIDEQTKRLVKKMIHINPEVRPQADQILRNPIFKDVC